MAIDARKNFAKCTVSTGYDASATSIALTSGHGARLPTVPFNAVWWNSTDYPNPADDPSVEIVRVTARSTDTLTVSRAQEGTSASTKNTAAKTYLLLAAPTKKMVDDIEADIAAAISAAATDATTKANAAQAAAVQRSNHTGTQAISTVSGLQTALDAKEPTQTVASLAEAEAGSEAAIRSFSPLRIFQAIAAKLTLGTWISGATGKATPVDADALPLSDSAASNALKSLTWANLKATLKTYFDTLYPSGSGTSTGTNTGDQTSVSGNAGTATALQTSRNIDGQAFNGTANITVIAPGTNAATSKATPVDADELPLVDSAASNVLKKLTWANLKATLKTYFDTLYPAGSGTSTGTNTGDQTLASLKSLLHTRAAKTGTYTPVAGDKGTLFDSTSGTFSYTFTAAATLGDGWYCAFFNSGSGVVTLDPNGSETIRDAASSATTKTLAQGEGGIVFCDGSGFFLFKIAAGGSVDQAGNYSWTGAHDFSGSGGKLKLPHTTAPSAEGESRWNQTEDQLTVYDGQRERVIGLGGWVPWAFPFGCDGATAFTSTINLAANGGTIAQPIIVLGHMRVVSVSFRNVDTTGTRAMEFRLYRQRLNNGNSGENTVDEVSGFNGTDSFTAAAASTRTVALGALTYIPPGVYWLVVRNTDATNTWGFGVANRNGTLLVTMGKTKTLGSALGSTLDLIAATWTSTASSAAAGMRLNGAVLGETTAW